MCIKGHLGNIRVLFVGAQCREKLRLQQVIRKKNKKLRRNKLWISGLLINYKLWHGFLDYNLELHGYGLVVF